MRTFPRDVVMDSKMLKIARNMAIPVSIVDLIASFSWMVFSVTVKFAILLHLLLLIVSAFSNNLLL